MKKNISGNPYYLYNYQMQEINNLINSMKLLISILESIKDYITLYYKRNKWKSIYNTEHKN